MDPQSDTPSDQPRPSASMIAIAVVLLAAFAWSYWPTLSRMVEIWESTPDYSHGYLIVPLSLYFLWARRDDFPGVASGIHWMGLIPILLSVAIRGVAGSLYLDAVDGWSIIFWVAGVVWILGGPRLLWWALPSVAFLIFMVPLPFRFEQELSQPLQGVATTLSTAMLQFCGQPAIAERNTILLGEHVLEIEQACAGLRIFFGIIALSFAYVVLVRRSWWERCLILVTSIPIAIFANAARITVTGLLYQLYSDAAARKFGHDLAGWFMIPFAALLFALVTIYLQHLFREVRQTDVKETLRGAAS